MLLAEDDTMTLRMSDQLQKSGRAKEPVTSAPIYTRNYNTQLTMRVGYSHWRPNCLTTAFKGDLASYRYTRQTVTECLIV